MGTSLVILGSQWGDEGKGKVVDLLTEHADAVVRFQGGNNAGHTIIVNGEKVILKLLPSGVLHKNVLNLIGNGVVVSLDALYQEIKTVDDQFKDNVSDRIRVSPASPLVLPSHIALDKAGEKAKGDAAIGTTKRGIGPAYEDKASRMGVRIGDLLDESSFCEKVSVLLDYHNFVLEKYYGTQPLAANEVIDQALNAAQWVIPMIADVPSILHDMYCSGKNILFEGAQGTFLDIDHGTYPYVTSSNTTAGGVVSGAGFGPRHLDKVLGITKAYTTRVGSGPFPTELKDKMGEHLATRGHEFGSVTGRARRCGWFDAAVLRRSVQLNSLSGICITKLDVLDNLSEVKIGIGYLYQGERLDVPPASAAVLEKCEPIYETLPGWDQSTAGITEISQLPTAARNYLDRICELTELPLDMISTGPARDETIVINHPFL